MPQATMRMFHDGDPRDRIKSKLTEAILGTFKLLHNQILVATYIRPEKTAGGIILADATRHEDKFQGKVGLVMTKGPLAFVDDDRVKFHGQVVEVDDWVVYRPSDGWAVTINGVDCRVLSDTDIKMLVASPDVVF